MLVNFCDSRLRTEVTCSTVSTEGYEVSNLVNNSDKGFLAYSCIRPPVTIDFVFICNIQISHVIIWPQIGAQKSCGFQLSVKASDAHNQPFTNISTVFLKNEESGVLFMRKDIPHYTAIETPTNFVQTCIKAFNITNYVSTLRLSILKTSNSVPALSKIQIWGKVSPKCGKDIAMNVMALWMNRINNIPPLDASVNTANSNTTQKEQSEKANINLLNIPEEFLDPITFEIMTQPIILPSGKIIDQKTLEKHAHNEAIWGRPVSDPFTGISFTEVRKPIAAFPLKSRIDKYLLENSDEEEIKKLPRVLGSKEMYNCKNVEIITCTNTSTNNDVNTIKDNHLKRKLSNDYMKTSNSKKSFRGHLLPLMPVKHSYITNSSSSNPQNSLASSSQIKRTQDIEKMNAAIDERLKSKIRVNEVPKCKCCTDNIFYKLPCTHIICRKALLSLEKNECTMCKLEFKKSDPERFHLCN